MAAKERKKVPEGERKKPGPKKGQIFAKTLKKEELRELYRDLAAPHIKAILKAQLDSAVGINHFMLRDPKTGQWMRLTDPDEILAALNAPEGEAASRYLVYAKDPNQQAATDILNRVMDKPKEQEQEIDLKASVRLVWDDTVVPREGE